MRSHENPALDVAITLANDLSRPVLVYQGLGGRHRYNSARHHTFILEGARDLAAGLRARGIAYAFHLPTREDTAGPLLALAARSCAVVTEDFPAPPFPVWTERVAARSGRAVLLVDCACVAPARLIEKRHTRAFAFRDAAAPLWHERVRAGWDEVEPRVQSLVASREVLGFEPVELASADIPALVAGCDIDQSVPAVPGTPGGMTAGYARWEAFKAEGLRRYADRRNDAADAGGVSRMSAYLHHGHVSPMRLAREASAVRGAGAEKFLDELLVWRELAFNFCTRDPGDTLETLASVPGWARESLAGEPRERVLSWEALARGVTGDALWDAAQASLVRNGELHNNVRMTWGKAVVGWTADAQTALATLIDLNHRFALDGSDPNSYGGLLWCLGQFDRPFTPSQPVFGTVRTRPTAAHAARVGVARYRASIDAIGAVEPVRVGVIGAGVAGLSAARVLADHGLEVVVLDKGRGPGGRLSTRRVDRGEGALTFDHGAPGFTVSDDRFARFARSWVADGVCREWTPRRVDANGHRLPTGALVVGVPGMNAVCRHLGLGVDVRYGATAEVVRRDGAGWTIAGPGCEGIEGLDAVIVAVPVPQAVRIVDTMDEAAAAMCSAISFAPRWTLMLAVRGEGLAVDVIDAGQASGMDLLIRDDSKPGRGAGIGGVARWVMHAGTAWSREHLEIDTEPAERLLLPIAQDLLARGAGFFGEVVFCAAHRWRYARVERAAGARAVVGRDGLVLCGDGFGGDDVEAAFLSGQAAAGRVLASRRPLGRRAEAPGLFAEREG